MGSPVLGSNGFAYVPLQKQAAMSSSQTPVHLPVALGQLTCSLHDAGSPLASHPELHAVRCNVASTQGIWQYSC